MKTEKLKELFSQKPPHDLKKQFTDFACVSLILKPNVISYDLAFIRRAHNPQDPWSGQIAFPGGRSEPADSGDLATALRETKEEVGWELQVAHFLGFLTDVQARNRNGILNFFLRPLVFFVEQEFNKSDLDPEEVDEVFWISLEHLIQEKNKTTVAIPGRGSNLPGIKLPKGDTLWGLTHMITIELLSQLAKS